MGHGEAGYSSVTGACSQGDKGFCFFSDGFEAFLILLIPDCTGNKSDVDIIGRCFDIHDDRRIHDICLF